MCRSCLVQRLLHQPPLAKCRRRSQWRCPRSLPVGGRSAQAPGLQNAVGKPTRRPRIPGRDTADNPDYLGLVPRVITLLGALAAASLLSACGASGPAQTVVGYGVSEVHLHSTGSPGRYHLSFRIQNTGPSEERIACTVLIRPSHHLVNTRTVSLQPGRGFSETAVLRGFRPPPHGGYMITCGPG